jgi:hypothetical protein
MKLKEFPRSWLRARRLAHTQLGEIALMQQPIVPVIVSLTSIPSRLATIHLTIRSLLLQFHRPEKIILWLHHDLQNILPKTLTELIGSVFEIRYVELTCSHRKLIHTLVDYPESVVVTCDDDLMYDATWLKRLYDDHVMFPRDIIAHECRLVNFVAGEPAAYEEWKTQTRTNFSAPWLMPIGYGGVLYPPHCLYSDVQNRELFLRLTPRADDLWFKAMSYLAGTQTRRSACPGEKPMPIIGSQKISLKKTNVKKNGNYEQWLAVCQHYGFQE